MKLIFALFSFFLITSPSADSQNYDLAEVEVESFSSKIQRIGKLDFKRTLRLSFKTGGYLTQLSVDAGDNFTKDQILASLDTLELIAQKNSTYALLLKDKQDVQRISELIKKNLSSKKELGDVEARAEASRSAFQVANYNLEKSQIIATFDGIVLARYTELGELQSPGREILHVASLSNNWVVKVALTEAEISQVKLKQKVQIRLNTLGFIEGEVSKIPALSNNQNNLYTIEILLPQSSYKSGMIAGQLAQVTIDFASNNYVYRIPISALVGVDENGLAIVVTQTPSDKQLQQQTFEIHKLDNQFVYLRADISDSSLQIVTKGWQQISVNGQ